MDQGVQIGFTGGLVSINLPDFVLAGLVVLLVAFYFRRKSLSDRGKWDKAWDPIPPSLKENPAPMVTAWRAWGSLVSSWWTCLLFVVFLALALDLAVLRGDATRYVWDTRGTWLQAVWQFLRSILLVIAGGVRGSSG